MTRTVKICLVVIPLSVLAVYVFKIPWGTLLPYGIFLLCPLMHVMMMKNMGHNKKSGTKKTVIDQLLIINKMKHNPVSTAHAAGATTAVVFVACRLLVGLFPDWMFSLGQSWFHGIGLQKLGTSSLTAGSFFSGLVSATVSAWLVGYLFAYFYNFFLGKK